MTIFCDFDGTLIDCKKRYEKAAETALLETNGDSLPTNYWQQKRENTAEKTIFPTLSTNAFINYENRRQELLEDPGYLKFDSLFPDTKSFLQMLRDKKYHIILVSMRKKRNLLREQIKYSTLDGYFAKVLTPSNHNINSLEIKTTLMLQSGYFDPNSSLMLGDTELDYSVAQKLAIPSLLLTHGIRSQKYLLETCPQAILIKNLSSFPIK